MMTVVKHQIKKSDKELKNEINRTHTFSKIFIFITFFLDYDKITYDTLNIREYGN